MEATAPADAIAGIRWHCLLMICLCGRRREHNVRAVTAITMRRMNRQAAQDGTQQPCDHKGTCWCAAAHIPTIPHLECVRSCKVVILTFTMPTVRETLDMRRETHVGLRCEGSPDRVRRAKA